MATMCFRFLRLNFVRKQTIFSRCVATVLFVVMLQTTGCNSLHVTGTFKASEFYKFVVKFGIQRTKLHDHRGSQGYIFGNISTKSPGFNSSSIAPATFVVVDQTYFAEFYRNRTKLDRDAACRAMFGKIDSVAYDSKCFDEGREDFLRKVPCPKGELCTDEDVAQAVFSGYQFTYGIQDINQPRFWYISFLSCYRNVSVDPLSCSWVSGADSNLELDYNIWLVNGHPDSKQSNPFEHEFSFEQQDTFEMYAVFLLLYILIVPMQVYALSRQRYQLTMLFTLSLTLEPAGILLNLAHLLKFAFDGSGLLGLAIAGDMADMVSQTLFMLMLLLVAKGCTATKTALPWQPALFAVWIMYLAVNILLYVWNMTEIDPIQDIDEYQTWPGWITLAFRMCIMVWLLKCLRATMMEETNDGRLQFLLHFGAASLVWFCYLPFVVVVDMQVSPLWRPKILLGLTYSADFIANAIMVHLLWPSRTDQYLHATDEVELLSDELEEFNEAPQIIRELNHNLAPKI